MEKRIGKDLWRNDKKRIKMKKTHGDTKLFHSQVRVGKRKPNGKPKAIRTTKIRTMKKDAHRKYKPGVKELEDKRITKVGKVLRRLKIDELPQIINLLKGELVPVGLRPRIKIAYRNLDPELRKIYDDVGPGLMGVEYACKNFPPSKEELIKTAKEFHKLWKKNKMRAYTLFGLRILRNMFKPGVTE